MSVHADTDNQRISSHGGRGFRLALAGMAALLALGGCTKKAPEIPTPRTQTVSAYGVTLDPDAGPELVTYVLLRALADDVHAAREGNREAQKKAQDLAFSLAAYDAIEPRLIGRLNKRSMRTITDLGESRNALLYDYVLNWGKIVAYYADGIPTEPDVAIASMVTSESKDGQSVHVYVPMIHDPAENDPETRETATLEVTLVRQKATGVSHWRVDKLDYPGATADRIIERASRAHPAATPAGAVDTNEQPTS